MKKTLLLLASAALLLVGCAKEQVTNGVGQKEGGLQEVTFTANLDSGVATKAAVDGDGAAASVNRCIMEIYYGDDLYTRQIAKVSDKQATFSAQVPSNRTYTVAFWADKVDDATTDTGLATDKYYTTSSLKTIALNGSYLGNDDARDAFFVCEPYEVKQGGSAFTATLKRPFAQVNVITTDWDKVASISALKPEKVNVTLKNALVAFNAVTGVASGAQTLNYEAAVYTPAAHGAEKTLSMDYLFASDTKALIDIDWKAQKTGDDDVEHAFAAVPYQRNYRTNIKGALLTATGQWTVTVDPDWDGDGSTVEGEDDPYLVNYFATGSIAAANEALKTKNAVSIENPSDLGTAVVIPAEQDGKSVLIKVAGASAGDITVQKATDNGPASLAIESDSKTLNIDLPNSHVDLNMGNFTSVTANTSATTLVVGKDVTIDALTINGGNAKIYGVVNTISKQASSVVDFYAGTAASLRSVAAKISEAPQNKDFYGKVYLTSDIDLNNEEWTPIAAFQKPLTIEGNGYTIKNLKVTESTAAYIGFIGTACGLTVKNLNFDTVTLSYPSTVGENARGGVIAGQVYGATIENCSVKNVDITACQKVGGLLGYIEGNTNVPHNIKNCSVEKISIKSNDPAKILQHGVGGFIGHIALTNNPLVSISDCSVKDVTISDFGTEYSIQLVPHAFIGNVCNNHTGSEVADITSHSVVLSNNSISGTNTVLPTCMYSSDNFGWAGNAEERPTWKGGIYINGEPWTPNYPYQIVETGAKYSTLASAIDAATAGQTVQILKAGEYKFPGAQKAITVEGLNEKDEDENYVVAFNLREASGGNKNVTFKYLTFNLLQAEDPDRGFTECENLTYNECVFTGEYWGYDSGMSTFNNCVFHDATNYCIWTYGGNITLNDCEFYSDHGKFVNVYATGSKVHTIFANNCIFHNTGAAKKAAFNLKGGVTHGSVVMNSCSVTGNFPNSSTVDGNAIFSDSGLYMFDDPEWSNDVYAVVDGVTYYPYFSMDATGNYSVKNVNGLRMAIKHWNALKAAGEKSLTLADGTYNVSDMAIFQNYADKSLLIKAENNKQAVITPNSGSKQLIFVVAGMSKSYAGHITVDGLKFDMSGAANKEIESDVISISDAVGTNLPADEKALYSGTYHYGHDITVKNCEIIGLGSDNEHSSVVRTENQNAYNVKVQNCTIDKVGYVLTSKISTLAEVSGCTITDSKCVINSTVNNTEYKIIGNTISTYNNYCIRLDYGPIEVKDNNFNITWTKETGEIPTKHEPAIVVLRNSTGNMATITGNTSSKADDTMYDIYCKTSWIVNGTTIPAENDLSF